MTNSNYYWNQLENYYSLSKKEKQLITNILAQKYSVAWCAHHLSHTRTLARELSKEHGFEIVDMSTMQKDSGIFLDGNKPQIHLFPCFKNIQLFLNLLNSASFQLYSDKAGEILEKVVTKNISFVVVFNEESELVSISEISAVSNGIAVAEYFTRNSQLIQTGILPKDKQIWIEEWK